MTPTAKGGRRREDCHSSKRKEVVYLFQRLNAAIWYEPYHCNYNV